MKRLLIGAMLIVLSASALAGIRVDGQLIREGDNVAKLVKYMGGPAVKSAVKVRCGSGVCLEETWSYFDDDRTWIVVIRENQIQDISWER